MVYKKIFACLEGGFQPNATQATQPKCLRKIRLRKFTACVACEKRPTQSICRLGW